MPWDPGAEVVWRETLARPDLCRVPRSCGHGHGAADRRLPRGGHSALSARRSAFDTVDHALDLWIRPDGSWRWQDEDEKEDWVRRGRFTSDEVVAIRAEGERVLAEWPFPTGSEGWRPDPSSSVPTMPERWEARV